MILEDVTGDTYRYGILTDMTSMPAGEITTYYTYELDVGGSTYILPQTTTRYPVDLGPIRVEGDPAAPERLGALQSAGRGEIVGNQFESGGARHTISDSVAVYEYRSGNYYLSTLARVREGDFTLTGWYDKADSAGGRLRVIVAREA